MDIHISLFYCCIIDISACRKLRIEPKGNPDNLGNGQHFLGDYYFKGANKKDMESPVYMKGPKGSSVLILKDPDYGWIGRVMPGHSKVYVK